MPHRPDQRDWTTLIDLSPASGLPLQLQVRQAILAAIQAERLPPGARIASARQLAQGLKVARNTIVLAMQPLIENGVLEVRGRAGVFVAQRTRPQGRRTEGTAAPSSSDGPWRRRLRFLPSRQRNIAKPTDWQAYPYPFVYGQSDPALFPINEWRDCARAALSAVDVKGWSQDLVDGDYEPLLRELRTNILPRRGIWPAPDEIMLTLGAQHGLFLSASLLSGKGTLVGFEEPGYPDARNIFAATGARVLPLPVDGSGLAPLSTGDRLDLIYATPSAHCPTGVALCQERRRQLLEHARASDALIIEDDYGADLMGDPRLPKALKGEDRDGRVIYVGSLSKVLAPGLRLGYLVAPAPLIDELRALRRLMLRHPPANNQHAAFLFISLGYMDRQFRRSRETLQVRADVLRAALRTRLPDWTATLPSPASSAWIQAPAHVDTTALAVRARGRGVLVEPGEVFFANPTPPRNCLRLGFASIAQSRIDAGITALAATYAEG